MTKEERAKAKRARMDARREKFFERGSNAQRRQSQLESKREAQMAAREKKAEARNARRQDMEEQQTIRELQLSKRFGNDRSSPQAFQKYAQFATNNAMRKNRFQMADDKLQDRYARQDANYSNQQQRASQQYDRINNQNAAFMDKYNALYNPPKEPTRSIQGTQDTTLGTQSQNPNTTMNAASARARMDEVNSMENRGLPKLKRGGKVKPKTKARGKVKAKARGNGIASRNKTCKMR